jgi:hypothetical protein
VDGDAVTGEPVVLLNPVAGLHEYVLAPEAESDADSPVQNEGGGDVVTTGSGLTVTITCAVRVQPKEDVPVTV